MLNSLSITKENNQNTRKSVHENALDSNNVILQLTPASSAQYDNALNPKPSHTEQQSQNVSKELSNKLSCQPS
jgi:hypothetical protein